MTSLRLRALMALAFAAFAAACGSDSGSSGPSFPDSVSTADAEDFADGIAGYAGYVADGMNFGGPSIALAAPIMVARAQAQLSPMVSAFPGLRFGQPDLTLLDWRQAATRARGLQASSPAAGCTVTAHGWEDPSFEDPVDLNGNGIPDDAYLKYVCSETDSLAGDTVVTQTTTQEIAIKEITAALYGETIEYNIAMDVHDNHGRYQFIHFNIDGKLDIRSGSVVDEASLKIRQETNLGGDVEFEEAGDGFHNSFDPATAINPESNIPDGDLTIGGRRYYANSDGENLSFSISTTDPLAYSATCAAVPTNPPFTDGSLLGKLNNSSAQASFTIDFTSCGNYDIAVDGAYDEPVVVSARR